MAEIQGKPDGQKIFGKLSQCLTSIPIKATSDLNIAEMKHVLSRVGDPLAEQDLENFFAMVTMDRAT